MSGPSVVILGPAHPYRGGGITTFNERLARAFQQNGQPVTIYNFTLQYPSFLFPGQSQYTNAPAPADIRIIRRLNSINPLNWLSVGRELKRLKPDILLVRFWIPLMGPAFGTVMRIVKKNGHSRVIAIADNVVPHEKRPGDSAFTKYFLSAADGVITMSQKVLGDLRKFSPGKPATLLAHPLYDNFGTPVSTSEARNQLGVQPNDNLLLFFGFIRKYKGLDLLLEAMLIVKKRWDNSLGKLPRLIIAGEFYGDEQLYREQINALGIADMLIMHTQFITDEQVKYFFAATDAVVQPYRNATQSGVIPVAYHFETPMIVTRVGALPDYVPDNSAGIVVEPNAPAIAEGIERFFTLGRAHFLPGLREEKKKYQWQKMVEAINAFAMPPGQIEK